MDRLPDELILHVLVYLGITDVIHFQQLSKRYLCLARDSTLWKGLCFDDSRAERERLAEHARQEARRPYDGHLQELHQFLTSPSVEQEAAYSQLLDTGTSALSRTLAFANWDPSYPSEYIDYYEEYVTRHAKLSVDWLDLPNAKADRGVQFREATGTALLEADGKSRYAVSSMDDGSIVIHDLIAPSPGSIIAGHSGPGLLGLRSNNSSTGLILTTNSGTPECISIDQRSDRAYFAVSDVLHEVDLNNLALVSSQSYPFPITALSAYKKARPLMVGTHQTVHIYDQREPQTMSPSPYQHMKTEMISHPAPSRASHISLSEPGPLSILHPPDSSDSVWVAGRFTSILQYSLRFFPRLLSTTHSGARISCLRALPYPYVTPLRRYSTQDPWMAYAERLKARAEPGWTAICAGEYKGKGSLELFGMSGSYTGRCYLNRQTAGRSKLLSVATHGGMIVHADGNGNLKWIERNGSSFVRNYNLSEDVPVSTSTPSTSSTGRATDEATPRGLFQTDEYSQGDIVQTILPFTTPSLLTGRNAQKLLLWTGEGRLGVLGFGPSDALLAQEWHDAVETQVENTAEKAKRDAERQFDLAMRRALERNADEVRFVRGLGLAGAV